jgi:hypothetical protein
VNVKGHIISRLDQFNPKLTDKCIKELLRKRQQEKQKEKESRGY